MIVGVTKKLQSLSQLEGEVVTNPWRELTSSLDGYSAVLSVCTVKGGWLKLR